MAESRQRRAKKHKLAMRYADKVTNPEVAEMIRANPDLIDEIMGKQLDKELDPNTEYARNFLGASDLNGQYPTEVLNRVRKAVSMPDITDAQAGMIARAAPEGPNAVNSIISKIVDDQRLGVAAEEKLKAEQLKAERLKKLFPNNSNEFSAEQLKGIGEEFGLINPTASEAARIRSGLQEGDLTQVLGSLQTDREQKATADRIRKEAEIDNERQANNALRTSANAMGDDYRKSIEPFMKTYNAAKLAHEVRQKGFGNMTGAQQMSTLYQFITALDPESVVREGEVALGKEMSNYIDRLKTMASKITDNNLLPEQTLKEISDELIRYGDASEKVLRRRKKEIIGVAEKQKIPSDWIYGLDTYSGELDGPSTFEDVINPQAPAAGGADGWQEIGGVKVRLKPGQ